MTKFKGPLKVGTHGAPGGEVDYVTIDTSGTASFAGTVHVSGASTFAGAISVAGGVSGASTLNITGAASFSGAVSAASTLTVNGVTVLGGAVSAKSTLKVGAGYAVLSQRVTIAANTTAGAPATISLPSGADIVDFFVDVEVPFATAAGATAATVHMSGANASTIAVMRVSASTTRYGAWTNADSFNGSTLRNVTATIEAHASIVGSATAMTAGQAMLTVLYVRN